MIADTLSKCTHQVALLLFVVIIPSLVDFGLANDHRKSTFHGFNISYPYAQNTSTVQYSTVD